MVSLKVSTRDAARTAAGRLRKGSCHGVQVVAHLRGAAALMYASRAGLLSTVAAVRIYLKDSRLAIHGPRWASTTRTRCGCGPDRRHAGSLTMSQTRESVADTHVAERAGSGNQQAAQYAARGVLAACSASCSSMDGGRRVRAACRMLQSAVVSSMADVGRDCERLRHDLENPSTTVDAE